MQKYLYILILILTSTGRTVFSQDRVFGEDEIKKMRTEKVKSIYEHAIYYGDKDTNSYSLSRVIFDEEGYPMEYVTYESGGSSQERKQTFSYDEKRNIIYLPLYLDGLLYSYTVTKFDGNEIVENRNYNKTGSLQSFSIKSKDENSNYTSAIYVQPGGSSYMVKIKYDEEGNKVEELYYSITGELKEKYVQDKQNKINSFYWYNSKGELLSWSKIFYDSLDNDIRTDYESRSGRKSTHFKLYDKKRLIRDSIVVYGEDTKVTRYEYDEAGNLIAETLQYTGRDSYMNNTRKYFYDNSGEVQKEEIYDENEKLEEERFYYYNARDHNIKLERISSASRVEIFYDYEYYE